MLPDDDQRKWAYSEHTKAKHAILIRYMKAWLSILGRGARASGHRAELAVIDAFAGRGLYTTGDRGSPLLLRDVAGEIVATGRADRVDLFYIESDPGNCAELLRLLQNTGPMPGVQVHGPFLDTFENAAPGVLQNIQRSGRSSFWFIDPFGYAGLPLSLIRRVLSAPRSEVFVTLMVRDMNRFLDDPPHQQAIAQVLDLHGDELTWAVDRVKQSSNRMRELRDVYIERLESRFGRGHGHRYVTFVQVAEDGPSDTVYYLVHVTNNPKGKREMKEAIWDTTDGLNAVIGPRLAAITAGQQDMFSGAAVMETMIDYPALKRLLMERFAGRRIEYEALQNEAVIGHTFDGSIDSHVKTALEQLAIDGVQRFRDGQLSARALRSGDILQFPSR